MFFDLHCHNTIKPYYSTNPDTKQPPNPDHWTAISKTDLSNKKYDWIVNTLTYELIHRNQSHFSAYYKGGFRCVCTGLYPIEQGFTQVNAGVVIPANLFLLADPLKMIASVIGISLISVKRIQNKGFQYYPDLIKETAALIDNQGLPNRFSPGKSYQIVSKYNDIKKNLKDPKVTSVILTVEGCHSFISKNTVGEQVDLERESRKESSQIMDRLLTEVSINIRAYKKDYPLFFITFGHHFYNLFCGHSPSVPSGIFNQSGSGNRYFKLGVNKYGEKLIKLLLERSPRRVLIDTKHMSPAARIWYHDLVKERKKNGDHIPIIQSHTAVSGRPSARKFVKQKFSKKPRQDEKSNGQAFLDTVNTSPLNLYDDEIREIVDSDGLIGVMLDEKRILGKTLPAFSENNFTKIGSEEILLNNKDINTYKETKRSLGKRYLKLSRNEKKLMRLKGSSQANKIEKVKARIAKINSEIEQIRSILRPVSCAIFLNQVLHLARVVNDRKIYFHICLGTDFDGVINPLDTYPDGSYINQFRDDLIVFWEKRISEGLKDFDKLRFGLSTSEIIDNLMWNNAEAFLAKYFTDKYLLH